MTRRPLRPRFLSLDPLALIGSTCTDCGLVSFPVRDVCPRCGSEEPQKEGPLSTEGVIHSFTIVRQAPPGVEVPYVLAYVDLPEEVRLLSRVEADDPETIDIGTTVRLVERAAGVTDDGVELVGYQFTPIGGSAK